MAWIIRCEGLSLMVGLFGSQAGLEQVGLGPERVPGKYHG
jgi:hypothetical protein